MILAMSAGWLAPAALALSWDRLDAARTVEKGAPAAEVTFHFVNRGASAVSITSIETSCKCTTAEPSKSRLEPGEAGELSVRMDVAARSGTIEKTITVTSTDAPEAPTVLSFRVTIHAALEASPRLLSWNMGDAASPKSAAVTADMTAGSPAPSVAAPTGVKASLVQSGGQGRYELRVVPDRTDKAIVGEIVISFQPAKGPREQVSVYAQVR
jgi:hypothetical protein